MRTIERYSIGTGDRFGMEGRAQVAAFAQARERGVEASIVWNKSNREHSLIGSEPAAQRAAADAAVADSKWDGPYYVDADHVGLATVERFARHCDFFTIDVADFIGRESPPGELDAFLGRRESLPRSPGLPAALDERAMRAAARRYLAAALEAGAVHRRIRELRGLAPWATDDFVTEVSMDETDEAQGPAELAVILAALADARLPAQTIAPKFSGRFNKGVDYVGDVDAFLAEFEADLAVVAWAPAALGLPRSLKLSIHSGSDKFSLYPGIGKLIRRSGAGLHLKTAGTTWLEEVIGLAESGGEGLDIAREIYASAYARIDELVAPYAAVVDIDRGALPAPAEVSRWGGEELAAALRHDDSDPRFDPGMRQLVHVAFRVAAEMGDRYLTALERHADTVSRNVTANLWGRHMASLFLEGETQA